MDKQAVSPLKCKELSASRYGSLLFALFLFCLGVLEWQISSVSHPRDHIYSDMHGYLERGWKIASGMPFTDFDAFYPSGNSIFYAFFFLLFGFASGVKIISIVQLVLIALANLLLALSTLILFSSKRLSLFVMFAASIYWPFISQASFFMAEPLFMFCIMLAFYLYCCGLKQNTWLSRGNISYRMHGFMLLLGLLLGYASLVKGQGLAVLLSLIVFTIFWRKTPWAILSLCAGALLPILMQSALHSANLGKPSFFLSANDAFNSYLGQSRHEAIGCLDTTRGMFFVFHNNNVALGYRFLEPVLEKTSILNRDYFRSKTVELWRKKPGAQLVKSLHNIVELFEVNPRWPQRNVDLIKEYDVKYQSYSIYLLTLPALYALAGAIFFKRYRTQCALCLLPIICLALMISMTMGQPRYIVPFLYFAFPIASAFYADLAMLLLAAFRGQK